MQPFFFFLPGVVIRFRLANSDFVSSPQRRPLRACGHGLPSGCRRRGSIATGLDRRRWPPALLFRAREPGAGRGGAPRLGVAAAGRRWPRASCGPGRARSAGG